MQACRPKTDRPQFVQPSPGEPRPDPRGGRWASPAQAAEAVGLSRGAVAEMVRRHPHLATWAAPPPVGGPGDSTLDRAVRLIDLDRLERAIERDRSPATRANRP